MYQMNYGNKILITVGEFFSYVEKTPDCWIWCGSLTEKHYGQIKINGRRYFAHRLAWELTHGAKIPRGLCACHHCDNPSCVRPDHIFIGTKKQNNQDRAAKGRNCAYENQWFIKHPEKRLHGEAVAQAKLAACDVLRIREIYDAGAASQAHLADMYDVSQHQISRIVRRKLWRHI